MSEQIEQASNPFAAAIQLLIEQGYLPLQLQNLILLDVFAGDIETRARLGEFTRPGYLFPDIGILFDLAKWEAAGGPCVPAYDLLLDLLPSLHRWSDQEVVLDEAAVRSVQAIGFRVAVPGLWEVPAFPPRFQVVLLRDGLGWVRLQFGKDQVYRADGLAPESKFSLQQVELINRLNQLPLLPDSDKDRIFDAWQDQAALRAELQRLGEAGILTAGDLDYLWKARYKNPGLIRAEELLAHTRFNNLQATIDKPALT